MIRELGLAKKQAKQEVGQVSQLFFFQHDHNPNQITQTINKQTNINIVKFQFHETLYIICIVILMFSFCLWLSTTALQQMKGMPLINSGPCIVSPFQSFFFLSIFSPLWCIFNPFWCKTPLLAMLGEKKPWWEYVMVGICRRICYYFLLISN